ncbi:MAG: endonuclease I family protein [Candidatus Muiribacteriaceae bacterium]
MHYLKKVVATAVLFVSTFAFSMDINNMEGAYSVILETNDENSYEVVSEINLTRDRSNSDNISYNVQSENRYALQNVEFFTMDGKIYAELTMGFVPSYYEVVESSDFELKLVNVDNPDDVIILSYNKTYNEFNYEGYYEYVSELQDEELKAKLHELVKNHHYLGYSGARREMFGEIDNEYGEVEGVYTGLVVKTNGIPNHTIMNCEHTWPQSKFGGGETTAKKSDIFHLYPTDSKANSRRGNYNFGNVVSVYWEDHGSKLGDDDDGYRKFEPRDEHKGNVARSMFYFSVRYNKDIPYWEEEVLREWNEMDPVDEEEMMRNNMIEDLQHNRNPFIDNPELADQISDF